MAVLARGRGARVTATRAAAGALARVESFAMPGLDGLSFALGAGRVCAMKPDGLRCAPANQVLDSRGQVLRASGDDTGGARGGRIVGQAITGKDDFTSMFVGLAFTCTRANNGWRCTGDDSYGQLASGALADPPRSAAEGRRAIGGALGAWHGCASIEDGTTECWGRNDVGQLGHVSPDTCRGGRATVACTRSPRETAAPKHGWSDRRRHIHVCDSRRPVVLGRQPRRRVRDGRGVRTGVTAGVADARRAHRRAAGDVRPRADPGARVHRRRRGPTAH